MNKDTLYKLTNEIDEFGAQLIVVTKNQPLDELKQLLHNNYRAFGENRVQDLVDKSNQLSKEIEWHMIGHLQTNKVKLISGFVQLIHSVDSFKLATEINRSASMHQRTQSILLEINISNDAGKYGFSFDELRNSLEAYNWDALKNISICGVMGMASMTNENQLIRSQFKKLHNHFDCLKQEYFSTQSSFKELSMGMSGDYKFALEEGSTMVRIGSLIFQ
ncbi:MAG: YggS family pyridoxal phosphate-dependent enzyme [Bacteroidota bacterium]|nr:YggS family pyridoxal phosphate-dependent enzyme [Bacteroidota bacterium]